MLGKPEAETNLVICHLGAGSSMCAVQVSAYQCVFGPQLSACIQLCSTQTGTSPPRPLPPQAFPAPATVWSLIFPFGNSLPRPPPLAPAQGGRSVDTSMGLTPLEGLMMGTRCGGLSTQTAAVAFY